MHDAVVAVAPFATEGQLAGFDVELRPPADQLANSLGRFADHHFHDGRIAQFAAGGERVGDVVLEAVFGIEHAGNAPLGILAVRLLQIVLADDQDFERRIDRNRRPHPGQPAADDQHVRKSDAAPAWDGKEPDSEG